MNPELPDEARALADAAAAAFADLGGVELARRAEADPDLRRSAVAPVLDALGLDDVEPRNDDVSLAAAAAVCEQAGQVALPWPLAAALVRDADGRPTAAVPSTLARTDHADLFPAWRVGPLPGIDPTTPTSTPTATGAADPTTGPGGAAVAGVAVPAGEPLRSRLGPFVGDLAVEPGSPAADPHDLALHQLLVAWTVLGACDRAVELAVDHVTTRHQFGKPLSAFQAVQFQLADAAVAVAGLRELAGFTTWRVASAPSAATADVLALRLHALEVARQVLRTAQQLHGAAGVCDEYDVSVLTRTVQPLLRLPAGVERTLTALAAAIDAEGFDGLFPHGPAVGVRS